MKKAQEQHLKKNIAARLVANSQKFGHAELPPEMRHVLKNVVSKNNIRGTSSDLGALTHVIIKDVKTDRKLQALTIARRLLYCCPLHSETEHAP